MPPNAFPFPTSTKWLLRVRDTFALAVRLLKHVEAKMCLQSFETMTQLLLKYPVFITWNRASNLPSETLRNVSCSTSVTMSWALSNGLH